MGGLVELEDGARGAMMTLMVALRIGGNIALVFTQRR